MSLRAGIAWAGAFAVLLAAGGSYILYRAVSQTYRAFAEPVETEFAKGSSSAEIAAELEDLGVIRSRWLFMAVRSLRRGSVLMAGEYRFSEPASPLDVFDRIARGDVLLHPFTVPEGLNRFEVAELVEQSGFASGERFLELTKDPAPIADLLPGATTLEGVLFPETYRLPRRAGAEKIIQKMVENFRKAFERASEGSSIGLSPEEALALASLIEKETGVPEERSKVSAVFHNRLDRGMLLQCDPTIIYGLLLEDRFRGTIYRSDIEDPHPYNTYIHPGLPPGPIASPGFDALRAAFHPAENDYLYFVAEAVGEPGHVFSRSLTEHNRAVARYRNTEGR